MQLDYQDYGGVPLELQEAVAEVQAGWTPQERRRALRLHEATGRSKTADGGVRKRLNLNRRKNDASGNHQTGGGLR